MRVLAAESRDVFARIATAVPALLTPAPAASGRLGQVCGLLHVAGALVLRRDHATPLERHGSPVAVAETLDTLERGGWPASPQVVADAAPSDADPASPPLVRFRAILPLPGLEDTVLVLWDDRPRSLAMAYRLLALAAELCGHAELKRAMALQEHNSTLFERASATARIGVWACSLPDLTLTWSGGVYDIFELPRGSTIDRARTLTFYTDESRRQMEALRARAIAECGEFHLDAEIITAKGRRRWMRLTGAVESHNGVARRILGMKQDITEEKLLADRTRYLAEYDVMTGLANRSQFQHRLDGLGAVAGGMPVAALLIIDLDGFKQINDTHGHAIGDEYLKEAARRLQACCAQAELVARIGGDEFAALLPAGLKAAQIEDLAAGTVHALRQPVMLTGRSLPMSASVGVAHHQGQSGDELFRQADMALYAAKATGRGTSQLYRA